MDNKAQTIFWIIWMLTAMSFSLLTYNPIYLAASTIALIILSKRLNLQTKRYFKTGILLGIIPLIVNIFFVHRGAHILVEIPRSIPLVGGSVTFESLTFAAISILLLMNMVLIFGIFSVKVLPDSLIRVFPRWLSSTAIVLAIGLKFIPTITSDAQNILDAQRSRGLQIKRGGITTRAKNHIAIALPLLANSLSRSHSLAESMEARGYSSVRSSYSKNKWNQGLLLSCGLLIVSTSILLILKYQGVLAYWPYDSLAPPEISFLFLLSTLGILCPIPLNEK
ncbi:MAG: energy-coupling factor transporter transmembrane component T [Candidatus Altiarchaeota archaeon]